MKTDLSSELAQKLLSYGVGAGALTMAASAHATVITSDPSFTPFTGDTFYFSLQDPATAPSTSSTNADFELSVKNTTQSYSGNNKAKLNSISSGSAVAIDANGAALLGPNTTIGSATNDFGSGTEYLQNNGTGNFAPGVGGYVGLQIQITDPTTMAVTTDYGWAAISLNNYDANGTGATLYGYAYEDSGADITTPDVAVVPEPGTAALLVAGAAGVAVLHRRRAARKE